MIDISIIVPVYNTAAYLEHCVSSIIAQRYSNWEAIFIDDGSTDNSFSILSEYAKNDARIRVIRQENAGAGMARNAGIDVATGRYLVFLDSDDFIAPDYFTLLVKHDEDVVFIDVEAVDKKGKCIRQEYMSRYRGWSADAISKSMMIGSIPWGGVRKAVKTSLIKENNIKYSRQKIGEEALYSFEIMTHARTIGYIDKTVYFYTQRNDSLSHSSDMDPWGGICQLYHKYIFDNNLATEDFCAAYNSFAITATVVSLDRIASHNSFKEYKGKAYNRIRELEQQLIPNFGFDYEHMDYKSKVGSFLIRNNHLRLLYVISHLKRQIKGY